jgi:ABC-type transport system substrate-binding protein
MLRLILLLSLLFVAACDQQAWNDPYPNQSAQANTIYSAYTERPKHLDPAISYDATEWAFIGQIYEPILEYNYLLRPYKLQPLTAHALPEVTYDSKSDTTSYTIRIKPHIMYQPHPAFARDAQGNYIYHNLTSRQAASYKSVQQFAQTGSRELKAADYVYQIKRLADPTIASPIFGFISQYIVGLTQLRQELSAAYAKSNNNYIDLNNFSLPDVQVIDDYSYVIKIKGNYPQFIYWLEMPFFAPMPWEAINFYAQAGMEKHNLNIDNYPVGTGAFYLTEFRPERRIVMSRNPNFHENYYPDVGMPGDKEAGLLDNAGKRLPFVDQIYFSLEKESIPYWDKFMQGYYDVSSITSDNFNAAISSAGHTGVGLTKQLLDKGVRLSVSTALSTGYWGFNMLDETVGGYDDRARNLRKAIALAFNLEEYIAIFSNGRAIPANGPIPPGIEGYMPAQPYNVELALAQAKQLMIKAGYPNGINPKTGKPLQLYYDAISSGDPNEKAGLGWLSKQFSKIGIDLVLRTTDYNRFREKLRTGTAQIFWFGWSADYPDPENFLFLFYGANSAVSDDGINSTNYNNPEFNKLFKRFKDMPAGPQHLQLIQQMVAILQNDMPWVWAYFPQTYALYNPWYKVNRPSDVALNSVKYSQIDYKLRAKLREQWNQPIVWPFVLALLILVLLIAPAVIGYVRSTQALAKRV